MQPSSLLLGQTNIGQRKRCFAAHAISVCTGEGYGRSASLADVYIVHSIGNWVGIEVQVDDAVTQKRVARKLDLSGLPPDTHALTIAIGAAELLRASWAEVKLQRTNEQHRDVPRSVRSSVEEAKPNSTSCLSFGFRVATEEFARGLRQAGADASGRFLVRGPWSVVFRLGARQAFSTRSDDGSIRANSWLLGTGSLVRLTPPKAKASVELVARLDYARLQFYAEPLPGASASARAGSGWLGSAGVLGTFKFSTSSQIEAEFDAGGVIQGVSARDGGRVVVAMNGAMRIISAAPTRGLPNAVKSQRDSRQSAANSMAHQWRVYRMQLPVH